MSQSHQRLVLGDLSKGHTQPLCDMLANFLSIKKQFQNKKYKYIKQFQNNKYSTLPIKKLT